MGLGMCANGLDRSVAWSGMLWGIHSEPRPLPLPGFVSDERDGRQGIGWTNDSPEERPSIESVQLWSLTRMAVKDDYLLLIKEPDPCVHGLVCERQA